MNQSIASASEPAGARAMRIEPMSAPKNGNGFAANVSPLSSEIR